MAPEPTIEEPGGGPPPKRKPMRRRVAIAVSVLISAWTAGIAVLLWATYTDLTSARDELRLIQRDADGDALLDELTSTRLRAVEAELDGASDRISSAWLAPLRIAPFAGRQLESVAALTDASRSVVRVSATTLDRMRGAVETATDADTDRVALVGEVEDLAVDASADLRRASLGPSTRLLTPLREARAELAADLLELKDLTDDVAVAARGFGALLASGDCYLLLAANNAEMRAGSGMFLQAGELCFDDGAFSLGDLQSTSDLRLPDDAVSIDDRDLKDRWGPFLPNAEFRNLGFTPRFDATGPLAVRMWEAATGRAVAGALAVDPVALEVLLESTGPIEVDGRRYGAADIVDQLLIEQYEEALGDDVDQSMRRERLGAVAGATVTAFEQGGWDLDALADALPDVVAGRHILGWSNEAAIQSAFVSMGMAGDLDDHSMAISVLNRGGGSGGGKLDPFLDIDVELSVEDAGPDDTARTWLAEVRIENTVPAGKPTYVENIDEDTRFGVYEGILAVTLPGSAGQGHIEVDGQKEPLVAVGPDGPTRVVATRFELGAEQIRTFRVRFQLPGSLDQVVVEPSARVPATPWRTPSGRNDDGTRFTVDLYD